VTAPVLFVGGMDSSGGAGLLRDAATALSLDASHRVAVTAVTAQSDDRVSAVLPMPPDMVAAQIALAGEGGISAAKLGMLANAAVVRAVAATLPQGVPLVLDPVLQATSGRPLLDEDGCLALLELLLPRTTVLTPNLPELGVLSRYLGLAAASEAEVAAALLARGVGAVLVKGGHDSAPDFCEDRLYRSGQAMAAFRSRRWPATLRGTGCQLASAIAVGLAAGLGLADAVAGGKLQIERRFLEEGGSGSRE
jgi:hydroxymethylpyrimidine/phosphomethylpyrimidine kinase